MGGGAVAEGEEQVADAAADLQGLAAVVRRVVVLVIGEQRAVLGERRRGFAELLNALRRLVPELEGVRVGLSGLGGPLVGQAPQLGQRAAVLAVVHERGGVLLAQGAYDG